jgi:hypothetical protein
MRLRASVAALLAHFAAGPAEAVLNPGDLVVTDRTGARLWQVDPALGTAEVFSPPDGVPTPFGSPTDVATTSDRGVYVADVHRILEVNPDTGSALPLLELDFDPTPHLVAMTFDGLVAGLDADANDTLWAVEDRAGQPGRLWRIQRADLGWSRTIVQQNADLGRIGNGLAVTSDDDGNANDAFFTTPTAAMWNVDVGDGASNEIEPEVAAGSAGFGGNLDATGNCEDLLCTVLFARASWPLGGNSCTASQIYSFFIVAIIGGSEPLDYVLPCASAVALITPSDAYVLMVDFREIGAGMTTRVVRFHSEDEEWVAEHVAALPGYETVTSADALAGMDFVLAPEPANAACALVVWAVLFSLVGAAAQRGRHVTIQAQVAPPSFTHSSFAAFTSVQPAARSDSTK